ncbi:tetratricopeptide repeat protein [Stenotrophomonas sp.]|uniref:tetratricopeptide repeat protein n=1 Tax=Stenotrophomonas sp. TaxID=69392 RepID=UPI002D73E3AE|nr:tetratricopeptide repeat protein [Stenotrophomonas sp.]HYQ24608.1 tetratricopeptide repeat protein [Stenotrophomonas sp.]
MKAGMLQAALCVLLACSAQTQAQEAEPAFHLTTLQPVRQGVDNGLGHHLRGDVRNAKRITGSGDLKAAEQQLQAPLSYCRAQRDTPGRRALAFSTRRQYEQYLAEHTDGMPTEWLDITCASALQQLAYIRVEQRRFKDAVVVLEEAIALAPLDPESFNEMGVALIQLRRPQDALGFYQRALALIDRDGVSVNSRPVALRGIGFTLIELGELKKARATFEQVLEIQPNDPKSLNELAYIDAMEAR